MLEGVRALDLTDESGWLAEKILGDIGDPERSLAWLAGNTSKRGIALDLGYSTLCPLNPRLVHCAIKPFGQTGPRAHWRGGDPIAVAMGSNLSLTRPGPRGVVLSRRSASEKRVRPTEIERESAGLDRRISGRRGASDRPRYEPPASIPQRA